MLCAMKYLKLSSEKAEDKTPKKHAKVVARAPKLSPGRVDFDLLRNEMRLLSEGTCYKLDFESALF